MKKRKIPKKAVEPLTETCEHLSHEWGKPAATIFKEFLELMNKYADYFFREPWPEKPDKQPGLRDEDAEFIEAGGSHEDRGERFTLVCLRRNISMEGFDSRGFTEDTKFYGGRECWDCSVRAATELRKDVEQAEQLRRKVEEGMKQEEPSWFAKEMHEHLKKPDMVRRDKMLLVKLRLYEELGGAEGKSCQARNKYRCPYGEQSEQLIEDGGLVRALWGHIEWCHHHWNEPSIVDVTSYEDVLRAVEDGRLDKIIRERERHTKETAHEDRAL